MRATLAGRIRAYAFEHYVKPAREAGQTEVTIRAGEVHDRMGLKCRLPAVCAALGTQTFEHRYRVKRLRTEGPMQGASTTFTFEV